MMAISTGLFLTSCGDDSKPQADPTETATAAPDQAANVCPDNPDPATPDTVQVTSPRAGDRVSSPVTVSGEILAFEATFQVTVYNAEGTEIARHTGMSADGTTLSPFSEQVEFTVVEETPGCIRVFELSARDGSAINVVQIPVTLQP
jgi:hypothetical protein